MKYNDKEIPKKITSIEQLFGTLPSDMNLDDSRSERLGATDINSIHFDYTEWQKDLFEDMTIEELGEKAMAFVHEKYGEN